MIKKTHFIVNPASAAGRTAKYLQELVSSIDRRLKGLYSMELTQRPLDAIGRARRAVERGCELLVAVGGDGTLNEILNGLFSRDKMINPDCRLGFIASGTSKGYHTALNIPKNFDDQVHLLCNDDERKVDLGKVSYDDKEGKPTQRYFINECQAGIGGTVVKGVQKSHKRLGGLLAFGYVTLTRGLFHREFPIKVVIDGKTEVTKPLLGVIMALGPYSGGGMCLAPDAKVDDGLLDLVLIHEPSLLKRLSIFPKVYFGKHVTAKSFSFFKGKKFELSAEPDALLEADGELLGNLPCSVEIQPSSLWVKARV
jgi:YegS/Rv2252/BmrU family lipid kinase